MMRPMMRQGSGGVAANVPVPQVNFRPTFQGSPQQQMQRLGAGYTPDQIQKILMAQQQRLLQQQGRVAMVNGMQSTPNVPNMVSSSQSATSISMRPRATRMQADMSTAAAFVALQNAQNAAKLVFVLYVA
jgi:hypothetical protein